MEWVRGDEIGHGAFAAIYLAKPKTTNGSHSLPPCMAVKSCLAQHSLSLKNEKEVLTQLGVGDCHEIVRCMGDDTSFENGDELYNVFLEYASGGSLANYLKKQRGVGEKVSESDVRRYTKSILKGIHHIHSKGYVHCDIKLHNILVNGCDDIKICDFGLAKKAGRIVPREDEMECEIRGTPVYMAPESFNENEYEAPCDIWALGCTVLEMFTGKPAWEVPSSGDVFGLMMRISMGDELPEFPAELSSEGKDFLFKCFIKDPEKRWTAERLLNHLFVANTDVKVKEDDREWFVSPRCPFDFREWDSLDSSVKSSVFNEEITWDNEEEEIDSSSRSCYCSPTPSDRIMRLVGDGTQSQLPNWDVSEIWISVR